MRVGHGVLEIVDTFCIADEVVAGGFVGLDLIFPKREIVKHDINETLSKLGHPIALIDKFSGIIIFST